MSLRIVLPLPSRRQAPVLLACALALALGACATAPRTPAVPLDAQFAAASELIDAGHYAEAAVRFEALATINPQRAGALLARAAEAHALASDRAAAVTAYDRARVLPIAPAEVAYLALGRAALARLDGELEQALRALAFDVRDLADAPAARVLLVRAEAEVSLGAAFVALDDLVARDGLLDDPARRRDNAERVWKLLVNLRGSLDPAHLAINSPAGSRAWLELAQIARSAWQDPQGAQSRVEAWHAAHGDHPAVDAILPRLLEQLARSNDFPEKVALLLPLTGRFAGQAEAVRDGFMAAHYASGATPSVALFDTTDYPGGASHALEEARAWGASFMVGPLTREAVTELAASTIPRADVALLALNYLDGGGGTPDRFWQFGLLPEAEAAAVAEQASARGLTRAVVLHPKGDWGTRMSTAFEERFIELGGIVLSVQQYDAAVAEKDFSTPIMRMLNLDESGSRAGLLANLLGQKIESEPRRRRDAQFVFLAARDREAPLLRSQLRFHRAADLPTFATSHVNRNDGSTEPDLDGIEFADMPWAIASDDPLRAVLAALWPEGVARQTRLYALGIDAYRLIPQLANLPAPLGEPVPGATGLLTMHDGHRIHRDLFWARFHDGLPVPIVATPAAPSAPTDPPP